MKIKIREYDEDYFSDLTNLFWEVVHSVNADDYTMNQLDTWAPLQIDIEKWKNRIKNNFVIMAEYQNKIIGFGELSPQGCIDMIYVHRDYLRQKIGKILLECLIKKARKLNLTEVFTEASITAKPFFKEQGFKIIKKQIKTFNGVDFVNYIMKKII